MKPTEKHTLAQQAAILGTCEPYLVKIWAPQHAPHSESVMKLDIQNPDGSAPDPGPYSIAQVAVKINGEWCSDDPSHQGFSSEEADSFEALPFWGEGG